MDSQQHPKMQDPETMSVDLSKNESALQHVEDSPDTALRRGLKARHISMIAIGGALGTGLIIGTGKGLAQAGPAPLLIAFAFVGLIVFMVMAGLGEMAAWLPLSSGFTGYATRYCHPSVGFAFGWTYFCSTIIITPSQLTALTLVLRYWVPGDVVNPGVFVAVFLVTIFCINYFGGVRVFGEFEFWLSSAKVVIILGLILFSLVLACGGGPSGKAPGFTYWNDPGAFAEAYVEGATGKFLAFWATLVTATFGYLGTELVGVTAAEAQNPRRSIPKAIKLTFYRILVFFVLTTFLIGMIVPYNSPLLEYANKQHTSASASPFVVAAVLAGINTLPNVINACLCIFIFSAANSDLYVASRTIYGIAMAGAGPSIFRKTNKRGVPYPALILCSAFACLAFMVISEDTRQVFDYFINCTTSFGILCWISLLVTHACFIKGRRVQGIPDAGMPYVAPQGIYGTYFALVFCCLIAVTKSFDAFIHTKNGKFDHKSFITGYIGIPLYLGLFFSHKFTTGSKRVKTLQCDFYSGKDAIDREEVAYLEAEEATMQPSKVRGFYSRFISLLF